MKINKGFVLNPPTYLMPTYRISPFKTKDTINNNKMYFLNNDVENVDSYFTTRFKNMNVIYTEDGRSAIEKAIDALKLKNSDTVTIFTTSNNLYISGCVTQKIEQYCNWSRDIEPSTKVILVNHEFGYCMENMEYYKSLGYPIIEDFAHSFSASNSLKSVGKYSDFLIFSLSKYFPMQIGGVLIHSNEYNIADDLEYSKKEYIKSILSNYINDIDKINKKRLANYQLYKKLFLELQISETFKFIDGNIPAVFTFDVDNKVDLNDMKEYINSHGIESSVFYGKNSYFIPNNQSLDEDDIKYIFTIVRSFLEGEIS